MKSKEKDEISTLQGLQNIATLWLTCDLYRVVFLTGPPDFEYQNEKNLLSQRGVFLH